MNNVIYVIELDIGRGRRDVISYHADYCMAVSELNMLEIAEIDEMGTACGGYHIRRIVKETSTAKA